MIKGTNADCRVVKTAVSETTATVTLLIFAAETTSPAKAFRFWIKDLGTGECKLANGYTYWVDRANNYDFDANNVDTNKYKEVILNIDITDSGEAEITGNRWSRKCRIQIRDNTNAAESVAWESEDLSLVSDEFEIPTVTDVRFRPIETNGKARIKVGFDLSFRSQADFNYNNENFLAAINVRSVSTDAVLETKRIANSTGLKNEVSTDSAYDFGEPVVIEILITDPKGNVYKRIRKIYTPRRRHSKSAFVKTADGIREVVAFYLAADPTEHHESEWLRGSSEDEVIKTNYNNAAVKYPRKLDPIVLCYRTRKSVDGVNKYFLRVLINPLLEEEEFYDSISFLVEMNGEVEARADKWSERNEDGFFVLDLTPDQIAASEIGLVVTGEYHDKIGNSVPFAAQIDTILLYLVCREDLMCDETLLCNDAFSGYFHDGLFYSTRAVSEGEYIYSDPISNPSIGGDFVDIPTGIAYEWDGEQGKFVISYQ